MDFPLSVNESHIRPKIWAEIEVITNLHPNSLNVRIGIKYQEFLLKNIIEFSNNFQ